ncbi:hypothetical protein FXO37_06376 [Capsicum annuum]|nr:hypothetical protein FXO37_06376 [Capsicum annuum]
MHRRNGMYDCLSCLISEKEIILKVPLVVARIDQLDLSVELSELLLSEEVSGTAGILLRTIYMGPTDREIKEREESLAKGEKDRTHNMLIVGFGMNKDGQDYYLAQNSWVKDGVPWLCDTSKPLVSLNGVGIVQPLVQMKAMLSKNNIGSA